MSASSERWKADIDSMMIAAERALRYVEGMPYEDFLEDSKTQDAVVMNLIVLAEAAKGVPDRIRSAATDIPWRSAIEGFRNRAAHSNQSVDLGLDLSIVWRICSRELGELLPKLRLLLAA